jgi:myo-inositol catabolism protein IolC
MIRSVHVPLGYDRPLFILAFDHRESFERTLFGIRVSPTSDERAAISDAKGLIFEGLRLAVSTGRVPREAAGILIDEEFGADIARAAAADGFVLAMPAERSGREEFDFEYGAAFADHVEAFDPAFCKVLVRYNVEGDAEMNARQAERLARLSGWLRDRGRRFLFELLVPPTPSQLAMAGGDRERLDREERPRLMLAAIAELHERDVEPDVWKIEGLDDPDDCRRMSAAARADGRDRVACVVLGRGADEAAVARWLGAGAGIPGYLGFAVGRTIWWDAVDRYLKGSLDRSAAAVEIADRYARFVDVYRTAAAERAGPGSEEV